MKKIGILLILLASTELKAQNFSGKVSQSIFLVGNTADASTENLGLLRATLLNEVSLVILIYNGDILHENGLNAKPSAADSAFIHQLLNVVKEVPNAQVYFTPGDLDWNNSGEDGWKDVMNLESLINGIAEKKIFLPGNGCPGPVTIEVGSSLTIALINSAWWIHPYDRPHAPSTECNVLVEPQFIEELQGVIENAEEKNILIVGHHPAISVGN